MKFFYLVSLISLIFVLKINAQAPTNCVFPPPTGLEIPKPELPDVFQTRIEINSDSKKSTTRRLFYDFKKQKSALIDQSENFETRYIFDYSTNEIHILFSFTNQTSGSTIDGEPVSYSPIVCDSFSLTDTPKLNYLFGFNRTSDNTLIPGSAYHALNFKDAQYFNGTDLIRGIKADVYVSCQYIPEINSNFTATYYFSELNYSMPFLNLQYTRVPLRAVFQGSRLDGNKMVDFKDVYDFYEFRVNKTSSSIFQTPPGVVCANRKLSKKTPNITKYFKLSEEITENGITSYIKDLYYNSEFNAVRYERRNFKPEEETFYSTDPLLTVHDYNIGVAFTVNKYLGNCTITPISVFSFDSDKNYTTSLFETEGSYVIRLKSPNGFFLLDSDYVYTGKRIVNNIPSEVFISDRNKFINKTFISEIAFSSDEVSFQESFTNNKNIPISLWVKKDMVTTYSSFFNYDSSFQNYQTFDVSKCFPDSNDFNFRIKFLYKTQTSTYLKGEKFIIQSLMSMLTLATNESFTRFSSPRISLSEDGYLYVRSAILPNPPPITLFTKIPNSWLTSGSINVLYNLTTPDQCAAYCVRNVKCLSFDFGKNSKICYLNRIHAVNGTVSTYEAYNHYSRNTLEGFYSKESSQLYQMILYSIEAKKFILALPSESIILTAENIELISNTENRYGTTQILSKYNMKYPVKKFSSNQDKTILNINIDDCAKLCNEELGFECKSFDFCYLHGDCRLSSKPLTENENDYVESGECDLYEKDSLFHYTEYPTQSLVNVKDDLLYDNINSPSECAQVCDKEIKIHCRSFNYCPENNKCYLSQSHLIDSSDSSTQDLICSHYSRDYISDFNFMSSANITLDAELVYDGSSLEQCSMLCVTADGFNCKSFDFCPMSKKCLLNKGLMNKPSMSGQAVMKDLCNNYRREYFFVTSSVINGNYEYDNTRVLIGVSAGVGLLGLIQGTVSMVFYLRKKNML